MLRPVGRMSMDLRGRTNTRECTTRTPQASGAARPPENQCLMTIKVLAGSEAVI